MTLDALSHWLDVRKQADTRAGNHQSHTRVRNTSPPTQASNSAGAVRSNPLARPPRLIVSCRKVCVLQIDAMIRNCCEVRKWTFSQGHLLPFGRVLIQSLLQRDATVATSVVFCCTCGGCPAVWYKEAQ